MLNPRNFTKALVTSSVKLLQSIVDLFRWVRLKGGMKKLILATLFLLSGQMTWAAPTNAQYAAENRTNGLIKFIIENEAIRNFGLATLIKTRCTRYLPIQEIAYCNNAVGKMVKLLDFDVIVDPHLKEAFLKGTNPSSSWMPKAFVFVAFKAKLIEVLSDARTENYLNDLNQKLYDYLSTNRNKPNIWDVTKAHYKTDYMTAMAIAALFQDTSLMKLHLGYLYKANIKGSNRFHDNQDLLSRTIDTINLVLDMSEETYRELFYPKEVQKNLNRNIYHFYVPLFLAKALEKENVKPKYASTAAMMLTLTYEFITSANDYTYLYSDPKNITNDYKLKDIFGGYCGSNIAVRGMDFNKNFEAFKASFVRSTKSGVELLLRH